MLYKQGGRTISHSNGGWMCIGVTVNDHGSVCLDAVYWPFISTCQPTSV